MKVSQKLSDFVKPTPFQLWHHHVFNTKHRNTLDAFEFAKLLEDKSFIEQFYFKRKQKESLRCEILKKITKEDVDQMLLTYKPPSKWWHFLV